MCIQSCNYHLWPQWPLSLFHHATLMMVITMNNMKDFFFAFYLTL